MSRFAKYNPKCTEWGILYKFNIIQLKAEYILLLSVSTSQDKDTTDQIIFMHMTFHRYSA